MADFGQGDPVSFGQDDLKEEGFMSQLNAGIASTVDMLNPMRMQRALDEVFLSPEQQEVANKAWLAPMGEPAATGMNRIGIPTATQDPETALGAMGRGAGNAASVLPGIGAWANTFRQGGAVAAGLVDDVWRAVRPPKGMVANIADDMWKGLSTPKGMMAEMFGGAASEGAMKAAENEGAPPWLATTLGMAAPASLVGGIAGLKGADNVIKALPGPLGYGRRLLGNAVSSLVPTTKAGATGIASNYMKGLVGPTRSQAIADRIDGSEIGLTPAQQTADPNLLALERAAINENPALRDTLADRAYASRTTGETLLRDMGGDVADAQQFFGMALRKFSTDMDQRLETELQLGEGALDAAGRAAPESVLAQRTVKALNDELNLVHRPKEDELWNDIPLESTTSYAKAHEVAKNWEADLGAEGARHIPADVKEFILGNGWGDEVTARQMKVVYSNLRETARNAYAGSNKQSTLGKVANDIADAMLEDMGAVGDTKTEVGRAWATARAYSAAMHEKFDQGAVGKLLQKTTAGDTRIPPETALDATISMGGTKALAAYRKLAAASPDTVPPIEEYMRGQFLAQARDGSGNFKLDRANEWIKKNKELLNELPGLETEFRQALSSRSGAAKFALAADAKMKLREAGPVSKFANDPTHLAALNIFGARDPARAAREIARAARAMDDTGASLAGVKDAVLSHLMDNAMGEGNALKGISFRSALEDKQINAALQEVFDAGEIGRIRKIATELAKLDIAEKSTALPSLIDTETNQLLDTVLGFKFAELGERAAGGSGIGGGMRGAGLAVSRGRKFLKGLTNRRARKIITEAITDEKLFKALLSNIDNIPPSARNKLAPYFAGIASATTTEIPSGLMETLQDSDDRDKSTIFDFLGAN